MSIHPSAHVDTHMCVFNNGLNAYIQQECSETSRPTWLIFVRPSQFSSIDVSFFFVLLYSVTSLLFVISWCWFFFCSLPLFYSLCVHTPNLYNIIIWKCINDYYYCGRCVGIFCSEKYMWVNCLHIVYTWIEWDINEIINVGNSQWCWLGARAHFV